MLKTIRVIALTLLVVSLCTGLAFTDEAVRACGICEHAESGNYAVSAPGKISRGIVNIGFGWTNLFMQPKKSVDHGENLLMGIGKGFGYTLLRTIEGVAEAGLFFLPPAFEEPLKNCAFGDMGITGR